MKGDKIQLKNNNLFVAIFRIFVEYFRIKQYRNDSILFEDKICQEKGNFYFVALLSIFLN